MIHPTRSLRWRSGGRPIAGVSPWTVEYLHLLPNLVAGAYLGRGLASVRA